MKIPFSWIRDFVNTAASIDDIVERLTIAGFEVNEVRKIGDNWNNITVAQLIDVQPHPNADRLRLATVNLSDCHVTVVCGAPNLNIGDNVVFAKVGAQIIDGHTGESLQLKPIKIRGILSEGMICSERELGISENHDGIIVLPADVKIGQPLFDYMGDTILDIDITPNRPDCLSIIGIAREIAALTIGKFHLPETSYQETGSQITSLAKIKIIDPELCPRYCASILTDVKIGPSPHWMQQRLLSAGMRPINNVVDITNYVALEYGQPLHAFDFDCLQGHEIIVRRAKPQEEITTLDGNKRSLDQNMLVIADKERPVAVAGIMGGAEAEVSEATTSILLESANFNRTIIHSGSIHLRLSSEASTRFEKGLSTELAMYALQRATQLMVDLTGAVAAKGIIDVYPGSKKEEPILLPMDEVSRLLGIHIEAEKIMEYLGLLGFKSTSTELSTEIKIAIPWWRTDVTCKADLVEEIARIYGYEKIPTKRLSSELPVFESPTFLSFRKAIRDIMVSCGFQEIVTYSLTNLDDIKRSKSLVHDYSLLKVSNPMSCDLEYLRTTLFPNILATLSFNQRYQRRSFRLFELGKVFIARENDLPDEKEMLSAILCGLQQDDRYWKGKDDETDFFIAKGIVETLLSKLGICGTYIQGNRLGLKTSITADIIYNGNNIGVIGEIDGKVLTDYEIKDVAYLFEIDVEKLFTCIEETHKYSPINKYPSVTRDLAFVLEEHVTYYQIKKIIEDFPLVNKVSLFDFYQGEQVPRGKKSLAFRLIYQSSTHTLSDSEVDKVQDKILERLNNELGITLRR